MSDLSARHAVFIDPSSEDYLRDRLFDIDNTRLNRDGTLLPFLALRRHLADRGVAIHTADYLRRGEYRAETNEYWSMGLLDGYQELVRRSDVRLSGFMLFEPPLTAPRMYRALPQLTRLFEKVFVHNTVGDGYSLRGVDTARLHKLFWPQPYSHVVEPHWSRTDRADRIVVIAGHHNPKWRRPEYYSKRIETVAELSKLDFVDLYGRGWDRWWSRRSLWPTYWRHRRALLQVYRGSCDSKLETLSRYRFSLCLENEPMSGWISEKIFDCLYAGTIPIYLGAPDIDKYIPRDVFIDLAKYSSAGTLIEMVEGLSSRDIDSYRQAGKRFVHSLASRGNSFFGSLNRMVGAGVELARRADGESRK